MGLIGIEGCKLYLQNVKNKTVKIGILCILSIVCVMQVSLPCTRSILLMGRHLPSIGLKLSR